MLLIQGKNDEYGTLAQLDRIEGHAAVMTTRLVLPDCGHSPHRDQERSVLEAIEKFASDLRRS
jgi:pimeloyl-ACP methyl ester carboxylesterase